jgi:hypothetical protein
MGQVPSQTSHFPLHLIGVGNLTLDTGTEDTQSKWTNQQSSSSGFRQTAGKSTSVPCHIKGNVHPGRDLVMEWRKSRTCCSRI